MPNRGPREAARTAALPRRQWAERLEQAYGAPGGTTYTGGPDAPPPAQTDSDAMCARRGLRSRVGRAGHRGDAGLRRPVRAPTASPATGRPVSAPPAQAEGPPFVYRGSPPRGRGGTRDGVRVVSVRPGRPFTGAVR